MDCNKEKWKDISEYKGFYIISNYGRVKSLDRSITKFSKRWNKYIKVRVFERILKTGTNKHGYVNISLAKDGTNTTYILSRLVAKAFIPNPDNKEQVNHINGDKSNNSVSNLEWCTQSENQKHKYSVLGYPPPTLGKKLPPHTKLPILQYDLDGNLIKEWKSSLEAAKYFGATISQICSVCRCRKKTCRGFVFKYKDPHHIKSPSRGY